MIEQGTFCLIQTKFQSNLLSFSYSVTKANHVSSFSTDFKKFSKKIYRKSGSAYIQQLFSSNIYIEKFSNLINIFKNCKETKFNSCSLPADFKP